jgi:glycosyltransferase involved in cell wall biosynthesis
LFLRIRDLLAQRRIRMLVLLGYNNLTLLFLMHWARARRIPLALTGDSNIFDDSRHGALVRGLKQLYLRHVVGLASALMPMGTCGRAYYRLYANHAKPTFLFPYEPDYSRFEACDPARREDFMRRHGLEAGRRRLVYSGRLVAVKRVDLLLDAFARIMARRPDWDLVIAGDGPLREPLQSRLPVAARARVRWLGFLQIDDLACCYHACDALVLPSEREPWGLVVNEAVSAGLAVVATEVSGAAVELVRHGTNGLLVPPRNVDALADALLAVSDAARNRAFRREAAGVLSQWRLSADPVEGLREALRHFQLLPEAAPCHPKP